ncbi:hypothetical protein CDAR_81101 [Caerostris darwini]|uniref:Uncharacterized protein n=1 Tax=Caerostris darwini TaxID=1538125 RepID=A0AAV4NXQ9_9ARAC|nr:hypothetical protein CDAR_81101 [Caerostris darwini]
MWNGVKFDMTSYKGLWKAVVAKLFSTKRTLDDSDILPYSQHIQWHSYLLRVQGWNPLAKCVLQFAAFRNEADLKLQQQMYPGKDSHFAEFIWDGIDVKVENVQIYRGK